MFYHMLNELGLDYIALASCTEHKRAWKLRQEYFLAVNVNKGVPIVR